LLVVPAAIGLRRRWLWGSWVGSIALAGTVAACGQVSVRSPSLAQGQQATLIQIVYSAPAAEKVRNDSPVLVRKVDAITGQVLGDDRQLGNFTGVRAVSGNSAAAANAQYVLLQDLAGEVRRVPIDSDALGPVRTSKAMGLPATVVSPMGVVYQADGDVVVATDSRGATVGTYSVPAPHPGARMLDGKPIRGMVRKGVASLLLDSDERLYAFVANSVNSALVDLSGGRRLDLPGFGFVLGATRGADGKAYALLRDTSRTGNGFVLAQFDLQALKLLRSAETSVAPSQGSVDDIHVIAAQTGELFVYSSQASLANSTEHKSILVRFDASTLAAQPIDLPGNLGLDVSLGVDNKLYIFGGPGRETISRYDPSTGTLSQRVATTPPGTYVRAVFVR